MVGGNDVANLLLLVGIALVTILLGTAEQGTNLMVGVLVLEKSSVADSPRAGFDCHPTDRRSGNRTSRESFTGGKTTRGFGL